MSKTWVLDTSTKGTGASVVPLESTQRKPEPGGKSRVAAPRKRLPKREKEPAPRLPRRFKVVDLMSSEILAEGARIRATLDVLKEVRSPVDVRIFVWDDEADQWRLLTLSEQRAMWDAGQQPETAPGRASARPGGRHPRPPRPGSPRAARAG